MRSLVDLTAPFWAGEAEIVQAYCEKLRTNERDIRWLRAQAFKETIYLNALPLAQQNEYWQTGRVKDHPGGVAGRRTGREVGDGPGAPLRCHRRHRDRARG